MSLRVNGVSLGVPLMGSTLRLKLYFEEEEEEDQLVGEGEAEWR